MCQYVIPFYCQIIFHCVGRPHFVYPPFIWWTFWVVSFWLLWIILLWTFQYQCWCWHLYSFLWDVYLGEFLGRNISLCLTFWGAASLFCKMVPHFIFPPTAVSQHHQQLLPSIFDNVVSSHSVFDHLASNIDHVHVLCWPFAWLCFFNLQSILQLSWTLNWILFLLGIPWWRSKSLKSSHWTKR